MVEYKFAKIRGTEYAVRGDNADLMRLYDATAVRSGRPGKPGEIAVVDGKRKMKIY